VNQNKNKVVLGSLEEVNDTLAKIAALQTQVEEKEAKMNSLILKVKNRYEPVINDLQKLIETFEGEIAQFGKSNKKLFKEQRSIKLTYGRIGYRLGKISLKIIDKKNWTWDRVREKVQDIFTTKYVEVKTKLQKNKIIDDIKAAKLSDENLAACGIAVNRSESFFYEINWDEIKIENLK